MSAKPCPQPDLQDDGRSIVRRSTSRESVFRRWQLAALAAVLSACGGDGGGGSTPPPPPPAAAQVAVTQTTPANDAVNVPLDIKPTVTFTAADATSISAQASIVCSDGNVIASSVSTPAATGGVLTVTPSRSLPVGSTCNVAVTLDAVPAGTPPSTSSAIAAIKFTTVPFTPKLYISLGSIQPFNPQPDMAVIDLGSGELQTSNIGTGCAGAFNPAIRETQIACWGGTVQPDGSNTQFPKHNPTTNVFSAGARFPAGQSTSQSLVECADEGRCFYVFGNQLQASADSRIGVVNSDQSVKATVAAPDQIRSPYRTRLVGGKVYILSQGYFGAGSANTASISRFDAATERFENFSATGGTVSIAQNAYNVAVVDGKILIGVTRGADGKDILAYDAATGARLPASDLVLPAGAINFAATATTLYVVYANSVRSFDLATGALKRVAEGVEGSRLALGNGKVYLSGGSRTIYELDPELLTTSRTFELPNGTWGGSGFWLVEAR